MIYRSLSVILGLLLVLSSNMSCAQHNEEQNTSDKNHISISNDGICYVKEHDEDNFILGIAVVDIGVNTLIDKTNYSSASASQFLNVPDAYKNESLFDLRNSKSINVNVWPVIVGWRIAKTNMQKAYISTGIGLQMYNFRFTKQVTYNNEVTPQVYLDTLANFSKNKLGFTYVSIPLTFTFKTKMHKKVWLVYSIGATGGYKLASWTKQKSPSRGKQKNHDNFNFQDFNACLTAEIGVVGVLRLYGTYQITPMHEYALVQHPLCLGIRIGGV